MTICKNNFKENLCCIFISGLYNFFYFDFDFILIIDPIVKPLANFFDRTPNRMQSPLTEKDFLVCWSK